MAAQESYPDDLKYHRRARLGAHRGRRGDARDHLVRAGRARRARPLRAAGRGLDDLEGRVVRRGRVGQGRLRSDRAALRRGARGEPGRRRRAGDGERGSVRRGLARAHPRRRTRRRSTRCSTSRRTGRSSKTRELPLAHRRRPRGDARGDRRRFRRRALPRHPAGMRFDRALDLEPPLTELELQRHLEELAARNVDTTKELSFLGAGIYDHYVPAIVDAVLQRGEFLTAYTPYQPEMSQGVLQAIFEYQTVDLRADRHGRLERVRLRRHDVVAADACLIAKHATGRSKVVVTEATNPQVRQVVKTYARGFGLEVVEVPHRRRRDRRGRACAAASAGRRCGDLPAAELLRRARSRARPRRGRERRRRARVAHVDPMSLGVLEAPGAYGCAIAIGEGQGTGNYPAFGGPHYGFLAARNEFIRRMPGRIIGETTDRRRRAGYVLTLQTREQHIRREKATSNITTNQTLLALQGARHALVARPAGDARGGGDLHEPRRVRAGAARGSSSRFPDRPTFKEFARPRRTERARRHPRRARARRPSRLRARPRLRRAWTTRCSSA